MTYGKNGVPALPATRVLHSSAVPKGQYLYSKAQRDKLILLGLRAGRTNPQIARNMGLAEQTVKGYVMESVRVLDNVRVEVKVDAARRRYIVEAAIPLGALGLKVSPGLEITGDFGVTHGNKAGNDTALRTYWSNRNTGLVSDEVFELQMAPAMWGKLVFKP